MLKSVTWETCSLRKWLNDEFVNEAFSKKEQKYIPTVTVPAHKNPKYDTDPGKATKDKVFLLSAVEVKNILALIRENVKLRIMLWPMAHIFRMAYIPIGSCALRVAFPVVLGLSNTMAMLAPTMLTTLTSVFAPLCGLIYHLNPRLLGGNQHTLAATFPAYQKQTKNHTAVFLRVNCGAVI